MYMLCTHVYVRVKMTCWLRQESQKTITNYHKFSLITCEKLEHSDWPVNALNDRPLFESLSICSSTGFGFVDKTHTDAFDFTLGEYEVNITSMNKHIHACFQIKCLRTCHSTSRFSSIRLSYSFSPQHNSRHKINLRHLRLFSSFSFLLYRFVFAMPVYCVNLVS